MTSFKLQHSVLLIIYFLALLWYFENQYYIHVNSDQFGFPDRETGSKFSKIKALQLPEGAE